MTRPRFDPTPEQERIIDHAGSAFISACPGAGKTEVLVARANRLLAGPNQGRGVAFLSFTKAAVSELEERLRMDGLLPTPAFPHVIGTFDSFLWQFLVAPFGAPGCAERPKLIPDKDEREVRPFATAQPLTLACFDRKTGLAIQDELRRKGFKGKVQGHESAAKTLRARHLQRGELDFDDARDIALARLGDPGLSVRLAAALAARFQEVIVDEAQDCNPDDLLILKWLRDAGIVLKVICDPHQAIYGFRGGVTDELFRFGETFAPEDRLPMTGNFRSSAHICKAIAALRDAAFREPVDQAIGKHKDDPNPIHILIFSGHSAPATIGAKFKALTDGLGLRPADCPVLAATRRTGASALGQPAKSGVQDLSVRLALAITDYHFAFASGRRKDALQGIHQVMLEVEGRSDHRTYHQLVLEEGLEPSAWRPRALALATALRFDPARFSTPEVWHDEARTLLAPSLTPGGPSINQRLKRNADLGQALAAAPPTGHCARTIHSVKGMEFAAACVVLSTQTAKGVMDVLLTGAPASSSEEARKVYVAASRAQRLLAIAVPKSQSQRLVSHLQATGAAVQTWTL